MTTHEKLIEYPVVIRLPVQWGDHDSLDHVNNVVYFRWFESARIAYLEQCQSGVTMLPETVGPVLASIQCDFKRQLTYPDSVLVGGRVVRMGRSSLDIQHAVLSIEQDEIVATARSTIVAFDVARQRPERIPEEFRNAVDRLEGRSGG